jgi:ADP-ribosylglycohydrolase
MTTDQGDALDKTLGCFYGVALGDAMGMPGELWPRARVIEHFGRIDRFLPGPDGHFVVDGFRAGEVTDDTQQTLMLAEAIIAEDGDVVPETVARHLVAWADRVGASEGNFLGPSSARAIDRLRNGDSLWETGRTGETNGAAMRIAPVGLIARLDDLEDLVDRVEASAAMSHRTDVAISGASAIAAAVAAAFDADPADPGAIDTVVHAALDGARAGARRGVPVVAPSIARRIELAVSLVRAAVDEEQALRDLYEVAGASVATTDTVPTAIALFVLADGDPHRSAILAANLGGDTDTIGAIVGGICGAFSGMRAIPEHLRATLDEVNRLPIVEIATTFAGFRTRRFRRNRTGVLVPLG